MSHWRQQVESFIRGRRWIVAHDVAQATAKGSYLRIILPDTTPVGPAVAPRIVRLLRDAAQAWDLPLDDLEAAPVY